MSRTLQFALAGAVLLAGHGVSLLQASVTNRQPVQPQREFCCPLGVSYLSGGGRVVLEQYCRRSGRSFFTFRVVGLASTCTHPPGTLLTDDRGRNYRMIGHSGLPPCESGELSQDPDAHFTWSFEQIPDDVGTISIVEYEDVVTQGMSYWAWRNVDISHCREGGQVP